MPAYVPDQVMDFYEALFKDLFITPFSAEILDRRKRNEMRRRVEALGESAAQSTIRMLTNQRVSETDVACILDGLRPLSVVITCEELAQTRETTQGLVEQLLTRLPDLQNVLEKRQVALYRATLYSILQPLLLIAPVLQEWRKHGFSTTYEPPERVIRQLNDISERMDEQSRMLEEAQTEAGDGDAELTYRDYLAQRFYQIEAGTLRITTNFAVDIRELFVMPLVQERLRRSLQEAHDAETALMLLDQARKKFDSRTRTSLAETGSASEDSAKTPLTALEQVKQSQLNIFIGAPGSGKSTFLEWLQLTIAFPDLKNPQAILLDASGKQQIIPLLLRVRQLNPDALPDVNQLVESAITSQDVAALLPEGWMKRQMMYGRILFMLDGIDEIAPEKRDMSLFPWLKTIIETYPDCRYLLSSRPTGYPAGALNELGFTECDLQDFDEERIRAYTTNWHTAIRLARNEPKDEAYAKGKDDANRVMTSFATNPYIQDLAKNPLMLSAICLVYEFEGGRLPEDRAKLYQLCAEGLLHNWDERRKIRSPFTFSEKLRACREVAIMMQAQNLAELDAAKVEEVFTAVLQDPDRAQALLAHLRYRAGLLVERRPDVFAFAHLTFQEYLTACAVHEGNQQDITVQQLAKEHADGRWREVIPLYTGLATSLNARQMLEELLVQEDTKMLCDILLDALSSISVEIFQNNEFRRRVLQRALKAPQPVAPMNVPGRFNQDEVYEMALECVGTSNFNRTVSAAYIVLVRRGVKPSDASRLLQRLQRWHHMTSIQITELVYLVHIYGDDNILQTVSENRDLYLSQGPNFGDRERYNTQLEIAALGMLERNRGKTSQSSRGMDAFYKSLLHVLSELPASRLPLARMLARIFHKKAQTSCKSLIEWKV
jgi:hypothetical protein